jgi:hypothetical protein
MSARRSAGRTVLLSLLMSLIALGLAAAASEVLLRVVYRDGGRRTLGGPGGQAFEYTYLDPAKELRGPNASGPKAAGVTRLMVMGDSITWGQGVTAWTDTYPARLLQTLNANGPKYDMAVFARPGKEIDGHLSTIASAIADVDPDVVVYQWYNNDVEIEKRGRPVSQRAWRAWPGFAALKSWSYLVYGLDFALDVYLPQRGRTYVQYMDETFKEGTPGWQAYTRAFHGWATYATAYASRTILLIYPPVPKTALAGLRQAVATLAEGQLLVVAPSQMTRGAGVLTPDTPSGTLAVPAGTPAGEVAHTPGVALAHGHYTATVSLRLEAPGNGVVARLVLSRGDDGQVVASRDVDAAALPTGPWTGVSVPFTLAGHVTPNVTLRIETTGRAPFSVDRVTLPVTYGIEVIDLAPEFGTMNTSASLFDAHPNAAAHAVMADVLARRLQSPPPR